MKRIKLVETKITNSQAPADFLLDYRREFLRLVEIVPEGITASQMGSAIRLSKKLQYCAPGNYLYLEDAEWEYLKNKVTTAKFNFVASEIVAMVDAVVQADDAMAPHLVEEAAAQ